MKLPYYQVNAFTSDSFGGNQAGVCLLTEWLPDATMQRMAAEHGRPETAFLIRRGAAEFDLRWFSPAIEVDLCGHATLASAHVLWRHAGETSDELTFQTKSGALRVQRESGRLAMNFPARPPASMEPPTNVSRVLGVKPEFCGKARDYFFVLESEEAVRNLRPDIEGIAGWDTFAAIVTARGEKIDFVSRFFPPRAGMDEDPATGSSHCTLIPYWAEKLGRTKMSARQLSARGGEIFCEALGDRVKIAGEARTYFHGTIEL